MKTKIVNEINDIYVKIKPEIINRIKEFVDIWENGDNKKFFIEMVFCLLTPQSSAKRSWQAVTNLLNNGKMFTGNFDDISTELNIVRFKNNKTNYILEAREKFYGSDKIQIKSILKMNQDVFNMREWLVKNIKGYGFKEASHYLRNIGLGSDIAILDRHILKNMILLGLIEDLPKGINRADYYFYEKKLSKFSEIINIPLNHLDFVLWYKEAGEVFK